MKIVEFALSLPEINVARDRVFSSINKIWITEKMQLNIQTLEFILNVIDSHEKSKSSLKRPTDLIKEYFNRLEKSISSLNIFDDVLNVYDIQNIVNYDQTNSGNYPGRKNIDDEDKISGEMSESYKTSCISYGGLYTILYIWWRKVTPLCIV